MTRQERFMHRAIKVAREGIAAGQLPFGAAIVRNDRVIACQHNTVSADQDPTAHAEVCCIRAACRILRRRDLSDCEIYSTCEPCAMCTGACYAAGALPIFFGAYIIDKQVCALTDLGIGAAALCELSKYAPRAIGGICHQQCVDLFRLYAKQTGSI